MAEKRKRRQAKSRSTENPFGNLPVCKLDFKSNNIDNDNGKVETFQDPTAAAEKAKDLLKSQRESVDMLTMVREKVEGLPKNDILSAFDNQGYFVVDDFLGHADRIAQEAQSMFDAQDMEADTSNLGSGEYIVPITGGEQYTKCPRSVELVVSTAKHLPEVFEDMNLDASACMATMRSFDYKTLKASMSLLLGSEEENLDDSAIAFEKVVFDDDDQRKLTMFYYVVPESWNEDCGGGLTFSSTGGGEEYVAAKYDRLVLLKSDSTMFKKDLWKGSKGDNEFGARMELHLVNKKK